MKQRGDVAGAIQSLSEQIADIETHLSYAEQKTDTKEVRIICALDNLVDWSIMGGSGY